MSFLFFLGGSGVCAECWYFFADSVLGRGKLCPFFLGGEQGLSGVLVFLYGFSAWEGKKNCVLFLGGGAESERSAGMSLRIQCLGGENCVLFFWRAGERSLSGVLVFLYGFSAWEGKTVSFFFFGGGVERSLSGMLVGISLRIQCLGGENCVLFFLGGERSLSGVLVFLYGFSAWEGETVSFSFFGGERSLSGVLVFLYGFSAWEGKTVSLFFFGVGGGSGV